MTVTLTGGDGRYSAGCTCGWQADTLGERLADPIIRAASRHAETCPPARRTLFLEGHFIVTGSHSMVRWDTVDGSGATVETPRDEGP